MNPLASFLTLLLALRADLHTRLNDGLKSLPPLEQIEAGSQAAGLLSQLDWIRSRVENLGGDLESTLMTASKIIPGFTYQKGSDLQAGAEALIAATMADSGTTAVNAAVAEKKVVLFSDHELALTAARETSKEEGRADAETTFNASRDKAVLVTDRRAAAITRIGALAAGQLTDDQLGADDHEATLTAIEGRIAVLKEKHITEEGRPKIYAGLIACILDETRFTSSLDLVLEGAGGAFTPIAASAGGAQPPKPSTKGAVPIAAATGDKPKTVI